MKVAQRAKVILASLVAPMLPTLLTLALIRGFPFQDVPPRRWIIAVTEAAALGLTLILPLALAMERRGLTTLRACLIAATSLGWLWLLVNVAYDYFIGGRVIGAPLFLYERPELASVFSLSAIIAWTCWFCLSGLLFCLIAWNGSVSRIAWWARILWALPVLMGLQVFSAMLGRIFGFPSLAQAILRAVGGF